MQPENAGEDRHRHKALEELRYSRQESVSTIAANIAQLRVPDRHQRWIADAAAKFNIPEEFVRTVYLLEAFHRNRIVRLFEAIVLLPGFILATALRLPRPDFSIGVCQIKPSRWRASRLSQSSTLEQSNIVELRDLFRLMHPRTNIFAAAEVIASLIQPLMPLRGDLRRANLDVAELLAVEHFGFTKEQIAFEGYWLADLLNEITIRIELEPR